MSLTGEITKSCAQEASVRAKKSQRTNKEEREIEALKRQMNLVTRLSLGTDQGNRLATALLFKVHQLPTEDPTSSQPILECRKCWMFRQKSMRDADKGPEEIKEKPGHPGMHAVSHLMALMAREVTPHSFKEVYSKRGQAMDGSGSINMFHTANCEAYLGHQKKSEVFLPWYVPTMSNIDIEKLSISQWTPTHMMILVEHQMAKAKGYKRLDGTPPPGNIERQLQEIMDLQNPRREED